MKRFAEITGYDYNFIRNLAKQHGSWKNIVDHVRENKKINPLFGLSGFVTYTECYEFLKQNRGEIYSLICTDKGDRLYKITYRDRVSVINKMLSGQYGRLDRGDCSNLLSSQRERYKEWYIRPVWFILKDVGDKLNNILGD